MGLWDKLVGESPSKLMIKHGMLVEEASDLLPLMWRAYISGDDISEYEQRVSLLEKEADEIKLKLRRLVHGRFLLRFSREDITEYIRIQDGVLDLIQDTAKMMSLNRPEIPPGLVNMFERLIDTTEEVVDLLKGAILQLRRVLESDFAPNEVMKEEGISRRVDELETNVDVVVFDIGKWLFSHKDELHPLDAVFLRELALTVSHIADATENVVDKIVTMIG